MKNKLNTFYIIINEDETNAQILQDKPVGKVQFYEIETVLDFYDFLDLYRYSRKPLINQLKNK